MGGHPARPYRRPGRKVCAAPSASCCPRKRRSCSSGGRSSSRSTTTPIGPVFGAKHPIALGMPARQCWSEVWDVLEPLFRSVVVTGEAFWAKDHLFGLERHGYVEETYFDVSYDPVRDESGRVGGIFCIVSETTGRARRRAPPRRLARPRAHRRRCRVAGRCLPQRGGSARALQERRAVRCFSTAGIPRRARRVLRRPRDSRQASCRRAEHIDPTQHRRFVADRERVRDADRRARLAACSCHDGPWPEAT